MSLEVFRPRRRSRGRAGLVVGMLLVVAYFALKMAGLL